MNDAILINAFNLDLALPHTCWTSFHALFKTRQYFNNALMCFGKTRVASYEW